MHDSKHRREDPLLEMGYEHSDIQLPVLIKVTMTFFVFSFVCYIAGYIFLYMVNPRIVQIQDAPAPFAQNPPPAPNPLLQTNITTKTDIMELRQKETDQLTKSAVTDPQHGIYRIPVERALDLTAQRGLPEKPSNIVMGAK